jgi:hypothetical protein
MITHKLIPTVTKSQMVAAPAVTAECCNIGLTLDLPVAILIQPVSFFVFEN